MDKSRHEDILYEGAARHYIGMIELTVMPDYIHAVVLIPPTMNILKILQYRGGSFSRELLKRQSLPRYLGQSHKYHTTYDRFTNEILLLS